MRHLKLPCHFFFFLCIWKDNPRWTGSLPSHQGMPNSAASPSLDEMRTLQEEVRQLKHKWASATSSPEALKLQQQIEQEKKAERRAAKREQTTVMRRSRLCRKFYEEEYEKQQKERLEQQETAFRRKVRRFLAQESYRALSLEEKRRAIEDAVQMEKKKRDTIVASRAELFRDEILQHQRGYLEQVRNHAATRTLLQAIEETARRVGRERSEERIEQLRTDRAREEAEAAAFAAMTEQRHKEKRDALAQLKKSRHRQEKVFYQSASFHQDARKREDETMRATDRLTTSEFQGRRQLYLAEKDLRGGLLRDFRSRLDALIVESCADPAKQRVAQRRHESDLRAASACEARGTVNSRKRKELQSALEISRQKRTEEKSRTVLELRYDRLRRLRDGMTEQQRNVDENRLRVLEKRRGEKCEVECDAFVVPENTLEVVEDILPEDLKYLLVGVIRGSPPPQLHEIECAM